MKLATKIVLMGASGILAGLLPAAAVTAAPDVSVAPDGSRASVSANESGPDLDGHQTSASGQTTMYTGSAPTSAWCGQVVGVGACATHGPDANVVPGAPTVCAWWFHDWSDPVHDSGDTCVNSGPCVLRIPGDTFCQI